MECAILAVTAEAKPEYRAMKSDIHISPSSGKRFAGLE
ncbi:hypothetical protein COLO4_02391 [Corchorus olitorius]|uniref:Uncharacterized protein n=1 Tax=Corchorus olitorius TaxID=93759 RepID=A0A1R3L115_9ROSI|nr:hypothetical protein COLO4_02391 [Corchorus olitorius]